MPPPAAAAGMHVTSPAAHWLEALASWPFMQNHRPQSASGTEVVADDAGAEDDCAFVGSPFGAIRMKERTKLPPPDAGSVTCTSAAASFEAGFG